MSTIVEPRRLNNLGPTILNRGLRRGPTRAPARVRAAALSTGPPTVGARVFGARVEAAPSRHRVHKGRQACVHHPFKPPSTTPRRTRGQSPGSAVNQGLEGPLTIASSLCRRLVRALAQPSFGQLPLNLSPGALSTRARSLCQAFLEPPLKWPSKEAWTRGPRRRGRAVGAFVDRNLKRAWTSPPSACPRVPQLSLKPASDRLPTSAWISFQRLAGPLVHAWLEDCWTRR